ncbi:MAG: hemolysin family protein [Fibrobacterales bacterium]
MDPSTIYQYSYIVLIGAFILSITLSLTKTIYSVVLRNSDPSRQPTPHEVKVSMHASKKGFLETIAIGRVFYNTLIAIVLWSSYLKNVSLFNIPLLDSTILFLLECIAIYIACFLAPKIIGHLKPYSLFIIGLWGFRVNYIIFYIPSRLVSALFQKTLRYLGYDDKMSFLTGNELKKLDSYTPSEKHGLEEDEKQMIKNIFEFGETPVKDIMTPRVELVALNQNSDLQETIETLNTSRFSRIPVYNENIDTIIGILNTKEFLDWYSESNRAPFSLLKLVTPPYFVTREKKIDDLMRELRKERTHIAIVVDDYGGTSGIVTLEDILEEIVGEIYDEDDDNEFRVEKVKENIYFVNPMISVGDLAEYIEHHIETPDDIEVETLSGLIMATLGTVPQKGAQLTLSGDIHIKILKVDGPRLEKVLLRIGDA